MDGSSSNPRPPNSALPTPSPLYQVPPAPVPGRQSHYRSLLQNHPLESSSSAALPPIPPLPTSPPPSYHQLYTNPGVYYTPPFVPGLDPSADPIQQQPRIAQSQFSNLPEWQPDHLVRNCPICDSPFTLFFRRHHCRKCGRVVCAQCSPNRLTLSSSAVVRPPGEVPPSQGFDALGLASSAQWGGLLGGTIYSPSGSGASNRHSWAGSISTPGDQNSMAFFDWRDNEDTPPGMEDVRVCTDCFSGTSAGQNEYRSASGSSTSIHRTWNGSSSPTTQGRPSASELWAPQGVNTPDPNGRRRRQSLQGGRSLPYNYDPAVRPNAASYMPQGSASGSTYTLPPPAPAPQPYSQHANQPYSIPPQFQAKYAGYFAARERMFGLSGSSSQHGPSSVQIPQNNSSQYTQPQQISAPHPQPRAHGGRVRVKLKETDYCPICTLPLPPPNPETGDESAREAHIQDCIRSHEAPSSPRGVSNPPSAAASPADNRGTLGSTPGGLNMMEFLRQSGGAPPKASGRMVVYKARDEDTWDYSGEDGDADTQQRATVSDGGVIDLTGSDEEVSTATAAPPPPSAKRKCRKKAECVICFEEFEVGELIARLECLCRYHKTCIREWFDRKGNGDCPVHAVRE